MTANQLIVQLAVLIEEVAPPRYDRQSGAEQPISAEEWNLLNERWRMIYVMNRPRGESNGERVSANTDGFPY